MVKHTSLVVPMIGSSVLDGIIHHTVSQRLRIAVIIRSVTPVLDLVRKYEEGTMWVVLPVSLEWLHDFTLARNSIVK